jgi:S1-C subfamily serine protease
MKFIEAFPIVVVANFCVSTPVWAQESKPEDIYTKALPSTMTLTVDKGDEKISIGTAFLCVKDGLAVTAWHVVKDAKRVVAKFSSGEEFEVSGIIDKDEVRDIALIRVKVFGRPMLATIATEPKVGSKAFLIGAPKGLDFSFSDGLVSQVQTLSGVKLVQFTCAASPGNSGGPLINSNGEVIGVVSWQLRDSQNLNFAIPVSYVLGLDSTLPTQPWESVKLNKPLIIKDDARKITVDEFDKTLSQTLIFSETLKILLAWVNVKVMERRFGFESGMPPQGYAIKSDADAWMIKMTNLLSPDPVREKWRSFTIDVLKKRIQEFELVLKAIKTAQINRGFTPEANELLREAQSLRIREPLVVISKEDRDVLKNSKYFMGNFPLDLQIDYNFIDNDEEFKLGVYVFPKNPTVLTIFLKDSLASQIGLKEGDKVIGANGSLFDTLHSFKMFLKGNLGKKIKITVQRAGKIQDIELKIPTLLPND